MRQAVLTSTPAGILSPPLYEYASGYAQDDVLDPGKGYWAYANQAGTLYLDGSGGSLNVPETQPGQGVPGSVQDFRLPLTVSDGSNSTLVSIGVSPQGSDGYDANLDFLAPPPGPSGTFDARLIESGTEYLVDVRGSQAEEQIFVLHFKPVMEGDAVVISWDSTGLSAWGTFEMVDLLGGQRVSLDMSTQEELIIEPDTDLAAGLMIRVRSRPAVNNYVIYLPMILD
ncbi:MAG: hypothetical protein GY809_04535 [Planctomycetes bacterium]|nr:hypothetical protein [Planctomycetota bacterium]